MKLTFRYIFLTLFKAYNNNKLFICKQSFMNFPFIQLRDNSESNYTYPDEICDLTDNKTQLPVNENTKSIPYVIIEYSHKHLPLSQL